MKMKKRMSLCLMAVFIAISAHALALSDAEVETSARTYVPPEATLRKIELDDGMYEATFFVEASGEKIKIKVSPQTGEVVELESEMKGASGAKSVEINAQQIAQAVEAAYPGAQVIRYDEERDDGLYTIDVFFSADGLYGTLELDAQDAKIIGRQIYFGEYLQDGMMSEEAARAALESVKPGVQITKLKLDEDDGAFFWEGDALLGDAKYEFSINAMTGLLVEWKRD